MRLLPIYRADLLPTLRGPFSMLWRRLNVLRATSQVSLAKTLGPLIGVLCLPKPLDSALEKLWGFASEQGRHLREGRSPRFEDAELVVTVSSAVSVYLLRTSGNQ
jgi:hypothetical protein